MRNVPPGIRTMSGPPGSSNKGTCVAPTSRMVWTPQFHAVRNSTKSETSPNRSALDLGQADASSGLKEETSGMLTCRRSRALCHLRNAPQSRSGHKSGCLRVVALAPALLWRVVAFRRFYFVNMGLEGVGG